MIIIPFRFLLIAAFLLLLPPLGAGSVEWRSLGYGTLKDSARFNVFVDTETIKDENGKVRFWQGHVFYTQQPLPSGKTYIRVSILRVVDCRDNTDSTSEAVFYGADGSIVDRYSAGGQARFSPVGPDTISDAVLKFVCNSGKSDR